MARIKRKRDGTGAQAALLKIEGREFPALPQGFRLIIQGMIASEEQDDLKACEYYHAGLDKLQETSGNPMLLRLVAETRSRMAISLARSGKKDVAKKIRTQERALLEARGEVILLSQCAAAVAD